MQTYPQLIEKILEKREQSSEFVNDVFNYLKVLAVKYCPDDRLEELNLIAEGKDLDGFYNFVAGFVPDLDKRMFDYIDAY